MEKENIIDLAMYRNRDQSTPISAPKTMSEELIDAIEVLICRLKEGYQAG